MAVPLTLREANTTFIIEILLKKLPKNKIDNVDLVHISMPYLYNNERSIILGY